MIKIAFSIYIAYMHTTIEYIYMYKNARNTQEITVHDE